MTPNKRNVLILGPVHPAGPALLAEHDDIVVEDLHQNTPDIAAPLARADALIVRTRLIDAAAIAAAPRLQIVARYGVGFDTVDVPALTARKIPLATVGAANSPAVAEHALFLMLAVAKQCVVLDRATRTDDWKARDTVLPTELLDKDVLLVGLGRIGMRVAQLCVAFGARVTVYDPFVPAADIEAAGFTPAGALDTALPAADIISLHLPLSDQTKHLVNRESLAAMKPTALLINTARGGLIDEAALVAALRGGVIRGAGLDVFDQEPPHADNPLFHLDNVVLSPHNAGLTSESIARMSVQCARNVLDAFAGTLDTRMVVNREVLDD